VKDEEVDWDIYHRITIGEVDTVAAVQHVTGYSKAAVIASVERLKWYLLITESDGCLKPLELSEMLFACSIRYTQDLPVTIDNGVIKLRRED